MTDDGAAPADPGPARPVRARLVRVTMQLDVVADDGTILEPVPVAPVTYTPADVADVGVITRALAEIEAQL